MPNLLDPTILLASAQPAAAPAAQGTVEQTLRETLDRLNLALSSAQMGTWEWDIATDQLHACARAAQLHGREARSLYYDLSLIHK